MADDILKNIPLPADLPENWTSGQIIAPTGAEAGLDDQHGYNYLMMQVNNAQKALKALAAQREEDLARIKFWASNDPTSPASFIGGTWERIEGKFIMGASDTYPAGSTGGSSTHHLTQSEIPNYLLISNVMHSTGTYVGGWGAPIRQNDSGYIAAEYQLETKGGNQPMDILNPYYSAYIWRRVA
jgi:hypothetical protein